MSSLYRLLRKGKIWYPVLRPDMDSKEFRQLHRMLHQRSQPPDCILVNAQSVADDMIDEHLNRYASRNLLDVPLVRPPFADMWIEFHFPVRDGDMRYAVQVCRNEGAFEKQVSIELSVWAEESGGIFGPSVLYAFLLDDTGTIEKESNAEVEIAIANPPETQKLNDARNKFVAGCALQALGRMNCKNVELRPINEGKVPAHAPNKLVPASVWHEIVVTSVPKSISGGRDVLNPGKENEIRAHWIRGHYADYRKGAGLFGNPKLKGLFWIPEHRRGNEELGQVIPEYTIQ